MPTTNEVAITKVAITILDKYNRADFPDIIILAY